MILSSHSSLPEAVSIHIPAYEVSGPRLPVLLPLMQSANPSSFSEICDLIETTLQLILDVICLVLVFTFVVGFLYSG
jgi:hypothetical protein